MYEQLYFLNPTLFNHQLILLNRFKMDPLPDELRANRAITVKIADGDELRTYDDCHIDATDNRRLRLPQGVMNWLQSQFPFSVAYFSCHEEPKTIWKNEEVKEFYARLKEGTPLDVPVEAIRLAWVSDENAPYLKISVGCQITLENASRVLSATALAAVLPYIFSSVQNTSLTADPTDGKKCYIIDKTTKWLSVAEYGATAFSHPGIYILRRKTETGYAYYVGKAADIKKRIVVSGDAITHPNEKGELDKQYDDMACVSINMDSIKNLYGACEEAARTPVHNPGVPRGSETDRALYAVEDVAIHTAAMILLSEGKRLDNRQYRDYTSKWLV